MDNIWSDSIPGRSVNNGGTEYLWFSGTDYLGLAHHPAFLKYIQDGLLQMGTHYGSSRNNTLKLKVFEETEQLLADHLGASDALTVSSGMWAGQLLIKMLPQIITEPYSIHYAPKVHPAIAGEGFISLDIPWKKWAEGLVDQISAEKRDILHVVISDATGAPWVEQFDFTIFDQLPEGHRIFLIIDDSHGFGVLGKEGRGTRLSLKPRSELEVITVGSLNKAMGISGGVIAGSNHYLQKIRSSGWYSGASPLLPAYAYALGKMIRSGVYLEQFEILTQNVDFLAKEGLYASPEWTCFDRYPALCSRNVDLQRMLFDNNILTSCFAYPTINDRPVVRLVVNAAHTKEDLKKLLAVLL
jgi:8-amino-7-oxononanoate synthase